MASVIWLIRHGETEWSRSGQHTGRTDIPLTDEGRKVATRLSGAVGGHAFARVWSSPLSRARETCALAGLGARVELKDALMEWDYGTYEGKTTPEIRKANPTWSLWTDGAPNGESPEVIAARADGVVRELTSLEGDTALFAHGHFLRVLATRWMALPVQTGQKLALGTASISKLGYERTERVLCLWNSDAHLVAAASESRS